MQARRTLGPTASPSGTNRSLSRKQRRPIGVRASGTERRFVGVRPELVRRNVLAVEKTAAELEASEEFQRLEARIAELREEVEHLLQSLDDADTGTLPAESTAESAE